MQLANGRSNGYTASWCIGDYGAAPTGDQSFDTRTVSAVANSARSSRRGSTLYYFCLGQKDRRQGTGCRERYVSSDLLENHVEGLYGRIELPQAWLAQLRKKITAEINDRQQRSTNERVAMEQRKTHAEAEKHKLMDAYYAGAIDVTMLKTEQSRIGKELQTVEDRLDNLDTKALAWQEILEQAMVLAGKCAKAHRQVSDHGRRVLNKPPWNASRFATARSPM